MWPAMGIEDKGKVVVYRCPDVFGHWLARPILSELRSFKIGHKTFIEFADLLILWR